MTEVDVNAMVNAASTCGSEVLVTPGDPSMSYLLEKLKPSPSCGVVMPPAGALPENTQACIEEWIAGLP